MACSCSEWTERKRISYVIKSSKSNVEWKVQAEDGEKIKKKLPVPVSDNTGITLGFVLLI